MRRKLIALQMSARDSSHVTGSWPLHWSDEIRAPVLARNNYAILLPATIYDQRLAKAQIVLAKLLTMAISPLIKDHASRMLSYEAEFE